MKYFTLEMSCNTQRIFITSSLFVLFIRKIYSFILSLSLTLTGVYKCYSHRSPLHIHSTSCELLKLKSFFYERDSCLCCYLSIQLFRWNLPCYRVIHCREVQLLSSLITQDQIHLKNAAVISLTRNHAQISNKNIQEPKNI